MASKKYKITQSDLINLAQQKLSNSGVNISKSIIEIAIKGYNEAKVEQLTKGFSFEESGIGVVSPSWRRVSKAFISKEPFTPKVVIELESSLKKYLHEQLKSSPEFRKAVGAEEL